MTQPQEKKIHYHLSFYTLMENTKGSLGQRWILQNTRFPPISQKTKHKQEPGLHLDSS